MSFEGMGFERKKLQLGHELNQRIQTPEGAEDVLAELEHSGLTLERRRALRDYALVVQRQSQLKKSEVDIEREGYSLHMLPDVENELPQAFIEDAYNYALEHGDVLKHATRSDSGEEEVKEIVWKFPGQFEDRPFVLKLVQPEKMPSTDHELRLLQRANLLGLPAPRPLGMMKIGDLQFLMMEFANGRSGQDIWPKLEAEGWTDEEIKQGKQDVEKQIKEIAQAYRSRMFIDKPWYIKDFLLGFDGHRITSLFPLDFERAHPHDPANPDKIRSSPPPKV